MYCKGCNALLNENDSICPKCGLDNNRILDETTEIYLDKISNPKEHGNRKSNMPIVIILVFILAIAIIILYIFKDSENNVRNDVPTTSTTITAQLSTFKFDNLRLKYDNERYGTSTNTIFLKENNNINIVLKSITIDDYNLLINSNEILDDKLGDIETKTFASENSYSHVFLESEHYYLIQVNYTNIDNENIQLELSRIIESLYLK